MTLKGIVKWIRGRDKHSIFPEEVAIPKITEALEKRDQEIKKLKGELKARDEFSQSDFNKKLLEDNIAALKQENDKLRLPYIQETRTQVLKEKLYQDMEKQIQDLKRELEKEREVFRKATLSTPKGWIYFCSLEYQVKTLEAKLGVARNIIAISIPWIERCPDDGLLFQKNSCLNQCKEALTKLGEK